MPGPAPKRNARRRNIRPDWRTLPADGFDGTTPDWPLPERDDISDALWLELWRTPQADAWNDLGWTRVVARYAVLVLASERGEANAALLAEIRQLEDRLGLSPMAMKRLQWDVGPRTEAPVVADGNVVELFG
jgi:hypothetical protein